MCGIAGILEDKKANELKDFIDLFKTSINHRGPDEYGYDIGDGYLILNTRLSILDLEHGSQPFFQRINKSLLFKMVKFIIILKLKTH